MAILKADNVTSGYGVMEILHGVTVEVLKGEIITIIGPNGAGKSTLMKTIFGLLKPMNGTVLLGDKEITGLPPSHIVRHGLCYVPQVENVFPSLTVKENLEMGAFIKDDRRVVQKRIEEIYVLFPILKARESQRVGKMSGGERQMVAMGRALMLDPSVLMLDEPTAALAPNLSQMIFEKVKEINKEGVSLLLVEQNAKESLKISHRGYVLADGKNKFEGTGAEILSEQEVGRLYLGG
jgi:ABC-type branched-subunit amino acid transport system ATPase component